MGEEKPIEMKEKGKRTDKAKKSHSICNCARHETILIKTVYNVFLIDVSSILLLNRYV